MATSLPHHNTPRKYIDKLALIDQRAKAGNSAYEEIMRDVKPLTGPGPPGGNTVSL